MTCILISVLREKQVTNYPYKAIHELMMNACMHRCYLSNMPTRLYQYDRHIEIMNPGGLYGQARPDNFPLVNDYRNNVVAEMMRTLKYVNMFNHGVSEVQDALRTNENPPAEFNVNLLTAFSVIIKDDAKTYEESIIGTNLELTVHQLKQSCSPQVKELIISIKDAELSLKKMQLFTNCSPKSKPLFIEKYIKPAIDLNLIAPKFPDTPRHPKQKYYLTDLGKAMLEYLSNNKE